MNIKHLFAAGMLVLAAPSSFAHVVFADPAAKAGSSIRGVLKVGHGCEGAATTSVTVTIPEGFTAIKPMPKAGWTVATRREKLAKPYTLHGKTITDDVRQITWKGGPLPDDQYDEFVLVMKLPETAGKQWFKVSQGCEKGSNEWVEIPAPGKTRRDLKFPAADLDLLPPAKAVDPPAHQH